jgi:lipopolysaccharide/colanic/teichoic acid biosynthesis glycosyltransferase
MSDIAKRAAWTLSNNSEFKIIKGNAVRFKRVVDILLSLTLVIISAPLFLLIAILIKIDSPGPVIFAQRRLGFGGKEINHLKFRTMTVDAERRLLELLRTDAQARWEYQKFHKLSRDPRITRMGKILRKFSMDELPQLWHVLWGDLSLVGPRAYLTSEYKEMGAHADLILKVRPGLTGWWQVKGRHLISFQDRLQMDEYYIHNWSIGLDLRIIIRTVWVIIRGQGD